MPKYRQLATLVYVPFCSGIFWLYKKIPDEFRHRYICHSNIHTLSFHVSNFDVCNLSKQLDVSLDFASIESLCLNDSSSLDESTSDDESCITVKGNEEVQFVLIILNS